ncbi:Guanine deaminase [Manis javanica]|nr:Guanine deaminase [Manis javanica]
MVGADGLKDEHATARHSVFPRFPASAACLRTGPAGLVELWTPRPMTGCAFDSRRTSILKACAIACRVEAYHALGYVPLHKPCGTECLQKPSTYPSIYSLLPLPLRLRPNKGAVQGVQAVGRLDQDTTGLLLLSDDGQFIHRMSSPKKHVPKIYRVTTKHPVDASQVQRLLDGVVLDDDPKPVKAAACEQVSEHVLDLTLTEGNTTCRKRMIAGRWQPRRGPASLEDRRVEPTGRTWPGQWRWLTAEDLAKLKASEAGVRCFMMNCADPGRAGPLLCTADAPVPDAPRIQQDVLIMVDSRGMIDAVLERGDSRRAALEAAHAAAGTLRCLARGPVPFARHGGPACACTAMAAAARPWMCRWKPGCRSTPFPWKRATAMPALATSVYDSVVRTLLAVGTTTAEVYSAPSAVPWATRCWPNAAWPWASAPWWARWRWTSRRNAPVLQGRQRRRRHCRDGTLHRLLRQHPDNAAARAAGDHAALHSFVHRRSLRGLGDLAGRTGAHVQTHCSESDWAHAHVLERQGRTDAHALHDFARSPRRTVVAHANFLTADDVALMARIGRLVAHCPLSNFYFANSVFLARSGREQGLAHGVGHGHLGRLQPQHVRCLPPRHDGLAGLAWWG